MNNFYLLNEALSVNSKDDFAKGIFCLNEIVESYESHKDRLLKHESLLSFETNIGYLIEIANTSSQGKLFWNLFKEFKDYSPYLDTEAVFDAHFQNECNCYLGFDFSATTIEQRRRITTKEDFIAFKEDCTKKLVEKDFDSFWENREAYFEGLVFCDNVYDCLFRFSIDDDRFLLIKEKLIRLNEFAVKWEGGTFPHYEMGINVSPDTKSRLKKSNSTRIYTCPDGTNKEFSWHIKLSAGTAYRVYYYPDTTQNKVIIGVIGTKPELGF